MDDGEEGENKQVAQHAATNWAFTVYGTVSKSLYFRASELLDRENERWGNVRYVLIGFETCPATGRNHIQGYMQLFTKKRHAQVKQLFSEQGFQDVHFERCFGSVAENIAYCKKDGFFEELGTPVHPGHRSDLDAMVQDILNNRYNTIAELARPHAKTYVRYHSGADKMFVQNDKPQVRPLPQIYYWTGATRVGKTTGMKYFLKNILGVSNDEVYWAANDCKSDKPWWQGYRGEKIVVWDDFKGSYPLNEMLRVLDTNDVVLAVKGTHHRLLASTFCFTSNWGLRALYRDDDQYPAWEARLDEFGVEMQPRLYRPTDLEYQDSKAVRRRMAWLSDKYHQRPVSPPLSPRPQPNPLPIRHLINVQLGSHDPSVNGSPTPIPSPQLDRGRIQCPVHSRCPPDCIGDYPMSMCSAESEPSDDIISWASH